jgi:hypothetical protein
MAGFVASFIMTNQMAGPLGHRHSDQIARSAFAEAGERRVTVARDRH